nr:hypothetical protein [Chlamydiota bacterium]
MIPVNYNSQDLFLQQQVILPDAIEDYPLQNQHTTINVIAPHLHSSSEQVYSLGEIANTNQSFNVAEKPKSVKEDTSEILERHIVIDTNGRDGANAGPNNVRLSTSESSIKIDYEEGAETFPMGLGGSIDLLAEGDPGRDGLDGAKGRSGKKGDPGKNATRSKRGTNGTMGTYGEHGSPGTDGGNGSNGGTSKVTAVEEDKDLFILINRVSVQGGRAGHGGRGGLGGAGGNGGIGGAPLSWKTVNHWLSGQYSVHYDHHTSPGGRYGRDGAPGKDGKDGKDGRSGLDGIFHFLVEDENGETHSYDRRYDLKATFLG